MATYSVTINEKTAKGKSILTILHSLNDVVTIVPQNPVTSKGNLLLNQTSQGAKEALEIKAGKRKGKTLDDLLNEK
jgi:hypothetical protein